jgi:hypothetical protein
MGPSIFTGEYLFAKNKGLLQQNCNIWITNRSNPYKKETGGPVSFNCLTIVMIGMTSYTITSGRAEAYYGQQQGGD